MFQDGRMHPAVGVDDEGELESFGANLGNTE